MVELPRTRSHRASVSSNMGETFPRRFPTSNRKLSVRLTLKALSALLSENRASERRWPRSRRGELRSRIRSAERALCVSRRRCTQRGRPVRSLHLARLTYHRSRREDDDLSSDPGHRSTCAIVDPTAYSPLGFVAIIVNFVVFSGNISILPAPGTKPIVGTIATCVASTDDQSKRVGLNLNCVVPTSTAGVSGLISSAAGPALPSLAARIVDSPCGDVAAIM